MSFNIIKFPSNLAKIANPQKFRDFCLKPMGYEPKKTSFSQKPPKVEKFVNHEFQIYRAEKPLEKNVVAFKLKNIDLSKPEIKQYLQKIYGLEIEKVHTLRTMGKIKISRLNFQRYRLRDWKKAYVELKEEVDPYYQKVEKM